MSDGITDAKRECKPIKYILPNSPPTRCKGCVFITCSPPEAQWECMNPIDTELLDKDNTCIYHLTAGELAEYCRRRLMAKLKGGTKVQEDKVNRPPCKWLVNHYCSHPLLIHTRDFKFCSRCKYHEVEDNVSSNDEKRVPCKWLRKRCDYANPWACASPALKSRMKLKDTDYCLGCSVYESQDVNDMSKDTELQCKHLLDNSHCANIDGFECPFVSMWDVAVKVCKGYGVKRRKYNVVDDDGERVSPISGPFDSEEEANKYIAKYIKVREIK